MKVTSLYILFYLLSFGTALAQASTDIWIFNLKEGSISGEPIKVTDRDGYDNQPQFGGDILFYTTDKGDQTDIYGYNTKTGEILYVTDTPESEYSPTPTPDGNHISVIMVEKDSSQRLWRYHLLKREREVVLMDLKPVGYHVWFGNYDLGLFVLGEPNSLYVGNSFNGRTEMILSDIGRSLNNVPGQFGQFSFVKNQEEDRKTIMVSDGFKHLDIVDLPEGTEDFNWVNDSTLVTGVGSKLYISNLSNNTWTEWADLKEYDVKEITRIAFDADRKKMALVISKN